MLLPISVISGLPASSYTLTRTMTAHRLPGYSNEQIGWTLTITSYISSICFYFAPKSPTRRSSRGYVCHVPRFPLPIRIRPSLSENAESKAQQQTITVFTCILRRATSPPHTSPPATGPWLCCLRVSSSSTLLPPATVSSLRCLRISSTSTFLSIQYSRVVRSELSAVCAGAAHCATLSEKAVSLGTEKHTAYGTSRLEREVWRKRRPSTTCGEWLCKGYELCHCVIVGSSSALESWLTRGRYSTKMVLNGVDFESKRCRKHGKFSDVMVSFRCIS